MVKPMKPLRKRSIRQKPSTSTSARRRRSTVAVVAPRPRSKSVALWIYGAVAGAAFGADIGLYGVTGLAVVLAMLVAGGCYIAANDLEQRLGHRRGVVAWFACSAVGLAVFITSWNVLDLGGTEAALSFVGLICTVWAANAS